MVMFNLYNLNRYFVCSIVMNTNSLTAFRSFVKPLQPTIGAYGGIRYYDSASNKQFKLKKIVYKLDEMIKKNPELAKAAELRPLICEIRKLEQKGNDKLSKKSLIIKGSTRFRQIVGNLFFNKSKVLNRIEFPGQSVATSKGPYRTLVLDGENGKVACRIRGLGTKTFPRFSKARNLECALRSHARMRNLIAVRGSKKNARMVGPCDYYGNLERPDKHRYTIDIYKGTPVFLKEKVSKYRKKEKIELQPIDNLPTALKVQWHKGTDPNTQEVKKKYETHGNPVIGESLFPNSGILEIEGAKKIKVKKFDARKYDLSPFKARLVKNNTPFQITKDKISALDEYRAVSYLYEPDYADDQVQNGGGLFLETHKFAQTMTPLDKDSKGFVTLGRWKDEAHTELEIIAVEIPFGYTLLIDKYCIHGDTNLNGMFMMCMTSNHVTMRTADTVFLKHKDSGENAEILINRAKKSSKKTKLSPIAGFDNEPDTKKFDKEANHHNPILNPDHFNLSEMFG